VKYLLLLLGAVSAWAQSATPVGYPNSSYISYMTMENQAVPTSPTAIATRSLILMGGWFTCGASGRTITLTDGNSKDVMTAVAVAANQIVGLNMIQGSYVSKGLTISASGTGCNYHLFWRQ